MSKPSTIAIDGPAASGKSTVGATLAASLDYLYFDTGVMYRTVTWAVLDRRIDVDDVEAISRLAETLTIDVTQEGPVDGRQYTVLADGRDVTWQIREAAVDAQVSRIAGYPRVRAALTKQQRRIANSGSIVMVGRDIGTVVLPNADLKIYLEASPQERTQRRIEELAVRGQSADFEAMLRSIVERDAKDRANPVSPMLPAADAIVVQTDHLSVEAVVAKLKELIATRNGSTV